jgi:hypothetical protein
MSMELETGIDNCIAKLAGVKMTKIGERTAGNMDVILEETCRGLHTKREAVHINRTPASTHRLPACQSVVGTYCPGAVARRLSK